MASLGFNLGFTFSNAQIQQHRKVSGGGRARVISCNSSSSSSSQASSPQGISAVTPLEIELEFFGPKPGSDGSYPVDKAKAVSGDKLLRSIMQDNKIELYAAYGKVMNCGGGGSCGTCIVEILDGRDLLNERTDTENRYLKKAKAGILETRMSNNSREQRKLRKGCRAADSTVEEVN
ncbi:unnamed protein product [Arabidopsis thaliana]|uniref:2Fe-2S ferredoxin-type domain-containing protein n=2 Tax=Arabidopsis thaliana TaxID=3702 RepID=A0A654FUZ1_ARATH|nr:2Fe-2S ferredoxin-like superfamily protein [Arabidopsis thaliana]AEE86086.1 2Fe-2S ferredoxin-like superfamily protein [Arabidopsis thaliana]CAA0397265.1 unnamed protein product [Arabidopsis thaliana]VYS64667.1 unnamed protein product [Arabidopsis thaliana]|eukprot:NP_001031772.1 2Fe-2S ferredoxin-like superfamily protein [Arabidopsis thaliana]